MTRERKGAIKDLIHIQSKVTFVILSPSFHLVVVIKSGTGFRESLAALLNHRGLQVRPALPFLGYYRLTVFSGTLRKAYGLKIYAYEAAESTENDSSAKRLLFREITPR